MFCSLTAYGWTGPDQERAGYDLASFFARTGISHEMTTQGEPPAPLMQGLGDTFTAMTGVAGILAALHERQQTGRGRMVDVSLLRTGMWALAGELGVAAMGGRPRPPYPATTAPPPCTTPTPRPTATGSSWSACRPRASCPRCWLPSGAPACWMTSGSARRAAWPGTAVR